MAKLVDTPPSPYVKLILRCFLFPCILGSGCWMERRGFCCLELKTVSKAEVPFPELQIIRARD